MADFLLKTKIFELVDGYFQKNLTSDGFLYLKISPESQQNRGVKNAVKISYLEKIDPVKNAVTRKPKIPKHRKEM